MQKARREIPYSAFLAAQAACRSLAEVEPSARKSAPNALWDLPRFEAPSHAEDDDVVVMTIN